MDPNFTGSVINALPIDKMISGPLNAMITAQISASKSYADFLQSVCIKDGQALQITFDYDETVVDQEGNYQGMLQRSMRIPLMAAIEHPNICIEEGTVDFELEVSSAEAMSSSTEAGAEIEASLGWGPFSAKLTGRVSHKSEQTRSTDTRAKYSFHTALRRQPPPEALMRVIDFLTDAATKPVTLPGNAELKSRDALPVETRVKTPKEERAALKGT
ncbi:MAG: DUF2589 domain-containing protein [Alphaproteobacteria bacterium]|nr:MAG: DUF2589 domain-containing protein [Alphaproteobacteria bacterium]